MLFQDVGESLVRQFLNRRHPVAPKLGQLVERVVVEGDQFTHDHAASCAHAISDQSSLAEIVPVRNALQTVLCLQREISARLPAGLCFTALQL